MPSILKTQGASLGGSGRQGPMQKRQYRIPNTVIILIRP